MTWSTPVNGVRHWNHKTFPEPSDAELEQYGWSKPPQPTKEQRTEYDRHMRGICLDCKRPVHHQSRRCWECHSALRKANADPRRLRGRRRDEVDESTVLRVLNGEWRLKTTKAEKIVICEKWYERGGFLVELGRLTGWRTERYFRVKDRAA